MTFENFNAEDCSISVNDLTFVKSLNKGKDLTEPAGLNKILMKSEGKSDFFNTPYGNDKFSNAPLLIAPLNNNEPFTFVAKLTPEFSDTYDAGAIFIFINNDLWQKFAFEMDEKKRTRLVTVRTIESSDDNNHEAVSEKSVFMKISSDVNTIGFYYSIDNLNWHLTRVYKNDFPQRIWIGVSSQSPTGRGNKTLFESFSLRKTGIKDFRKGI